MVLVMVAIVAIVAIAFVASAGEPSIEHQPTPTAQEQEDKRRADFEALPEHDKLRISEDIGVFYLPCIPDIGDRITTVLVLHFPSGSSYSADRIFSSHERYFSEEGRQALEAVRADETLTKQILERSPKSARCPNEDVHPLESSLE